MTEQPPNKIAELCEQRLRYIKLEGKYAKLRREIEMQITEEHLEALSSMNDLTDRDSPIWTRPDKILHEFSSDASRVQGSGAGNTTFTQPVQRSATVHFDGDLYYVKMYKSDVLEDTRYLPHGHSERYAEDCAENWVLGIIR